MQNLLEKLEGYSISQVLEEYSEDLREIEAEEGSCAYQPVSRYESDFVSVTGSKELNATYRRDYITNVEDCVENCSALLAALNETKSSATDSNKITGTNSTDTFGRTGDNKAEGKSESNTVNAVNTVRAVSRMVNSKLVNEMRVMFSENNTGKIDDVMLLIKLDEYLNKRDRCKQGNTELLKSIPQSAYAAYKDKICSNEATAMLNCTAPESSQSKDVKPPIKRRGGLQRKSVSMLFGKYC